MKTRWLTLIIAAFVVLSMLRFGQVLGQDEISHYYRLSRIFVEEGFSHPDRLLTFSPHLYPLTVCLVCRMLGTVQTSAMQLTGALFWILCLGMLWCIGQTTRQRVASCLLCGLMPAVQQAAGIIEIDQTALPFLTLALCVSGEFFCQTASWRRGCMLACCFCLALWGRLTTPLVLVPALVATAGFRRGRWVDSVWMAVWLGVGGALFLLTWVGYGWMSGIQWRGVFSYLAGSFQETTVGERSSGLSRIGQSGLYAVLWGFNPVFLMLVAVAFWKCVRAFWTERRLRAGGMLLLCGCWLLVGYGVVGGSLFGFPKYQMPAVPLLCAGIGFFAFRRSLPPLSSAQTWGLALLVGVVAGMCWLAGDPLWALRVGYRDGVAAGIPSNGLLLGMLAKQAVLVVLSVVLMGWLWRAFRCPVVLLLLCGALALNVSFSVKQLCGGYCTGYMYGDAGESRQVAAMILERGWTDECLLVPHEVLFETGVFRLVDQSPLMWGGAEEMLPMIREKRPPMVAVSVLCHPPARVRGVLENEELKKLFAAHYDFRRVGRYYLWVRKE